MSAGYGIYLTDGSAGLIVVSASLTPGTGEILVNGPVTGEFEHVFNRAFSACSDLADLGEFHLPDLSRLDLIVGISTEFGTPLGGESYGLLLFDVLARTFARRTGRDTVGITGILDDQGSVLAVEGIERKREAASKLGLSAIVLPAGQLDLFCGSVGQIPVTTAYELWGIRRYGQDSQA